MRIKMFTRLTKKSFLLNSGVSTALECALDMFTRKTIAYMKGESMFRDGKISNAAINVKNGMAMQS